MTYETISLVPETFCNDCKVYFKKGENVDLITLDDATTFYEHEYCSSMELAAREFDVTTYEVKFEDDY